MRSILILSILFTVILSSILHDDSNAAISQPCITDNAAFVEALISEGEIYPHIKLPAIEIFGKLKSEE